MKDKYLIKIEGKGLTLEEIADSYYELIDSDFNMTINDMANYLRCSYDYIQKTLLLMYIIYTLILWQTRLWFKIIMIVSILIYLLRENCFREWIFKILF